MTSERKINANRANARASTGPKTVPGRTRVARNAFRHGLSLPVCSDPVLSEEVETLARKIAGPDADAISMAFARQIAEAQIDLRRVCDARLLFETYARIMNVELEERLLRICFCAPGTAPDQALIFMRRYVMSDAVLGSSAFQSLQTSSQKGAAGSAIGSARWRRDCK